MIDDIKTFKSFVQNLIVKGDSTDSISDTMIDEYIARIFAAKEILGLNVSEEEKATVRNELLAENRIRLEPGVAIVPRTHEKWFDERKNTLNLLYWERFKEYLIKDKDFPTNVVTQMDKVSDEIVDLLGDPMRAEEREQRRGLIIGDVQSGKTANYSALICKAVDAGFRTVILMTGTTNDLRRQTQIRLDEAFVGIDTGTSGKKETLDFIGAGNYNSKLRPISFTTVDKDFSTSAARQLSSALSQGESDRPMLFVIKKNVSVLRNLLGWVKKYNQYATNKIDNSILMIDDEADYASVNTKAVGDDPSKTNGYIEQLLNVFRFSSYVGFTATPYANVFIDPDTDKDMEKEGLFPKDYIYSLNAPTDYIGARDIFPKNAKYHNKLRTISDGEEFYPLKHKKDDDFSVLSTSLREAINTFLLANVIRDLRGDETSHRSMMVNVTRFVHTQRLLQKTIKEYTEDIKRSVKNYASLSTQKALQDKNINSLFETFKNEYGSEEFLWEDIQNSLFHSILLVQVLVVHGGGDDLNYHEYKDGLRSIVVGGQRLSRGLTLEGLMVSYLYRNSMAYDTLMQMGRWFGYRKGYADICRIWMDEASQNWYEFISNATDELREEIKRMRDREATPLDFGLRVRNDSDIPLIVTAKNKMRLAKTTIFKVSLSQTILETPYIYNNIKKNNTTNLSAVMRLIEASSFSLFDSKIGAINIEKEKILELLSSIDMPPANIRFDPSAVLAFIQQYSGTELSTWDVVVLSGECGKYQLNNNFSVRPNRRKIKIQRDNGIIIMNQRKLGSPSDTSFGLSEDQLREVDEYVEADGRSKKNKNNKDYFAITRKPLLMIYFVEPTETEDSDGTLADFDGTPLIGFGIGIPRLNNLTTKYISYQTNRIHQEFGGIEDYEDDEDV